MNQELILAIDQGSSASKAILMNREGLVVARSSAAVGTLYPHPGWVEQDAEAIWQSVQAAAKTCLDQVPDSRVVALALCNQRESTLLWERETGRALAPMISWQDARSTANPIPINDAITTLVRERSGLPLDPMFSASKARWLLEHHDSARIEASAGRCCLGTVDAFLLSRLGVTSSEPGNASRTQLLNVHTGAWDPELLDLFGVPLTALPILCPSVGARGDGATIEPRLSGVAVHAVLGDSHAALLAHTGGQSATVKVTLGTGSSVMALSPTPAAVDSGICTSIAWDLGNGPAWAVEGNIRSAGATVKWLAELFEITPDELARIAAAAPLEDAPVMLVPAFAGLGAPWWDQGAVALLSGLTLGTTRQDLMLSAIDSVAHQVADVVEAIDRTLPGIQSLSLDGEPSSNPHLRSLIASYLNRPVVTPSEAGLSAIGAAQAAGLSLGWWTLKQLQQGLRRDQPTLPTLPPDRVRQRRMAWARALERARLRPESPRS
jgi:glycerol kinase